jgi:hypothetical protein
MTDYDLEKKRVMTPEGERIEQANSLLNVPESRYLELRIPIGEAARTQVTDRYGVVHQIQQFNEDQWRYIERLALQMLVERTNEWLEEMITPEVEFEPDQGIFPDYLEDDLSDEEAGKRTDFSLEGASAVIGVMEAIVAQFEEEAAKRDV